MLDGPLHPEVAWPALGIGVLAAAAATLRLGRRPPPAWAGVATVAALIAVARPATAACIGLVLLAFVGLVPRPPGPPGLVGGAALCVVVGVGLALLGSALPVDVDGWALASWLTIGAVSLLAAVGEADSGPRLLLVLIAGTAAGIWAAVPDTEAPVAVGAALLPVVLATLGRRDVGRAAADPVPWLGLVAAMTWACLDGGRARPGAAAAGLAAYGVVVTWGAAVLLAGSIVSGHRPAGGRDGRRVRARSTILVATQALTVLIAAQWRDPHIELADAWPTVAAAMVVASIGAAVAAVVEGRPESPPRHSA